MLSPIDALLMTVGNERHRRILALVRDHIVAELRGDIDATMGTMAAHTTYMNFSTGVGHAGRDATREFYATLYSAQVNTFEISDGRWAVADWGATLDGYMNQIVPGPALPMCGEPAGDADSFYLCRSRAAIVFKFYDEPLMVGEDSYRGGAGPSISKLDASEVVRTPDLFPS